MNHVNLAYVHIVIFYLIFLAKQAQYESLLAGIDDPVENRPTKSWTCMYMDVDVIFLHRLHGLYIT